MAIRRVGLIVYKKFAPATNPELANAYVDRMFNDGAEKLEALLDDGFTVVTSGVVALETEGVTFLMIVLHKPEGGLQP